MDILLWVVRAVIISVGIVTLVIMWKWKGEGRLKERFHIYFLVLGSTLCILGGFLLIVSWAANLSSFYGLYLGVVGIISFIIGLLMRRIMAKSRTEV
jgi:uncharacterized membrane protein SirB2